MQHTPHHSTSAYSYPLPLPSCHSTPNPRTGRTSPRIEKAVSSFSEDPYGLPDYGAVEKCWNVVRWQPLTPGILPTGPCLTLLPSQTVSATSTPQTRKKPLASSPTKTARPTSGRASRATASPTGPRHGSRIILRRRLSTHLLAATS